MKQATIALATVAILVFGASMVAAYHFVPPAVSRGGELAYVRDHAEPTMNEDGTMTVRSTYVSLNVDPANGTIGDYTSRGRFGDTAIFSQIVFEDGPTDRAPWFQPVQNHARGLMGMENDHGRILVLNGVNAGLSIANLHECTHSVQFEVSHGNTVRSVNDRHVEVQRDGHTFHLALVAGDGQMTVDGLTVDVQLGPHAEVRGWLSGFPATTEVMNWEFDHAA